MAKKAERIFLEICYDPNEISPQDVIEEIGKQIDKKKYVVRASQDRPPPVISDDYIMDRYAELLVVASKFSGAFSTRFDDKLYVDPRLMMIAVRSAYDDIARYKLYHLSKPYSDLSDCVKRASYVTKWLAKVKPLQMTELLPNDDQKHEAINFREKPAKASMANVMFALICAQKYFECELGFKPKMDQKIFHEAVYDLTYRETNIDSLLMFFQILFDRLSGNEIISKA